MTIQNPVETFKQEYLEKAISKSKEVYEFTREFQKAFPIESIPKMTLEEYLYIPYDEYNPSDSFCSRIWREATIMSSKGDIRTNMFGIYMLNNKTHIFGKYLEPFGDDIGAAYEYLRNEIYRLLTEVEKGNYEAAAECPINRAFRYKLLEIYFPDTFIHVHTESTLNDYCDCVGVAYDPKQEQIYRNLALAEWRDSVPEISDWNNSVLMSFCDWLWRRNIKIDGSAFTVDTTKLAKELENEINEVASEGIEKEAIVKVRVNQDVFRNLLLKKYGKCCLCGVSEHKLLVASHIKPWSECEPEERLDVNNGFLMCPNHDKLFDQGWISFDNNGKIVISEALSQLERVYMNVNDDMQISLSDGNRKYLEYHRNNVLV